MSNPDPIDAQREIIYKRITALNMEMVDAQSGIQAFLQKVAMLQTRNEPIDYTAPGGLEKLKQAAHHTKLFAKLCRNHADDFIRMGQILRRHADLSEPMVEQEIETLRKHGIELEDPQ